MKYAFWFILILLVILRIYLGKPTYRKKSSVRISSRVMTEPIRYEYSQGFRLEGVWVYLPVYPEISYGDEVIISGVVEDSKMKNAKLESHTPNDIYLFRFREKIIDVFSKSLPVPHDSLVAGMVIGSKKLLTRDFWEKLKITGTAHVVVASGMNVSLVASFLVASLVHIMNRRKALIFAFMGIWVYAVLAGFDAPIIRASVMGSLSFLAIGMGRVKLAWRSLFLSAAIMIFIKPDWIYDLGFTLSFTATAALLAFESTIRKKISFIPKFIREDLSTSLAAQIGVAPVLYFAFGNVNPLSPFINALILWTVVPITIIGAVGGIVGLFLPSVGRVVFIFIYPLTWWFVNTVELFS